MADFSRRKFLAVSGASTLMAAHIGAGSARAAGVTPERREMRGIFNDFQKARKNHPWTKGLINASAPQLETPQARIEGAWPEELKGVFYRTGPAQHERAGERYAHWFDGDGMVQKYAVADGKVSHFGRMVETPKYKAESLADRFLVPAFGTRVDSQAAVRSADDMNVANINMLPMQGEILALWEGGSAVSLDPETLETNGFKVWSGETKGLPFSAHAKVDPDGTVWNFGTANMAGRLVLYHIAADGRLLNVKVHPLEPNGMIHDFIVTERHLVLLVPPFRFEAPTIPFVDAFAWRDGEATVGLVFDKETLSLQRRFEMPGDFHFHFGNAWEEKDGTLRFDYCASRDASFASLGGRNLMRGIYDRQTEVPTDHYEVRVGPSGAVSRNIIGIDAEFPRIDPRLVGKRNRFVYSMWQPKQANSPFFTGVAQVDLTLERRTTFDYGPDIAAEEHIFVPRPGGVDDQDGWLLGTTLDLKTGTTSLNVFVASRLAEGPIAKAHLAYGLPMGLHGAFQPS